jgi:carotenoid cleavage dioxygenase-like enzyme
MQSATHFEMANYVLGLKSSAQCMSLVERDTKIYVASRSDPSHQMVLTKPGIMLHHANAYDDGDLVVVWSSGAGPDAMQKLREGKNSMGNMKLNSFGDFSAMPYTSLWQHRCYMALARSQTSIFLEMPDITVGQSKILALVQRGGGGLLTRSNLGAADRKKR